MAHDINLDDALIVFAASRSQRRPLGAAAASSLRRLENSFRR